MDMPYVHMGRDMPLRGTVAPQLVRAKIIPK